MFRQVFLFELLFRLKAKSTWVCLAALAAILLRDTMTTYFDALMGSGRVPRNSPYAVYYIFMFSTFWVNALAAGLLTAPLLRDLKTRMAPLVFSTQVTDRGYFWGKYLAGMVGLAVVTLGTPAGFLLMKPAAALLSLPASQYGPTPWLHLVHGWLLFFVPAMFLHGSVHFLLAARTGRPTASYVYCILHTIRWIIIDVSFSGGMVFSAAANARSDRQSNAGRSDLLLVR